MGTDSSPERADLEKHRAADMRAVTAQNDRLGRYFACENDISGNDFRALLHVMIADAAGTPSTMAQITTVHECDADCDHLLRGADDRCRLYPACGGSDGSTKVLLRCEESGMELPHAFSNSLGVHLRPAIAEFSDNDRLAVHQVLTVMVGAIVAF